MVLTLSSCLGCGFADTRVPTIYEVPEGFHGWVLIQRSKVSCPPQEVRDGKHVLAIPSNGRLCTSSDLEEGWAKDEYYFVGASRIPIEDTGWGGGGHIWLRSYGSCGLSGQPEAHFEHFFVGTEAEAKVAPAQPMPSECGAQ